MSRPAGPIRFVKMAGSGNDFIVFDNVSREGAGGYRPDEDAIRRMCSRSLSVGADGIILIEPSDPPVRDTLRMIYHNADGGRARLCGNGVRCVARLAALRGLAPAGGMTIVTDAGPLPAAVQGERASFRIGLGIPSARPVTLAVPPAQGGRRIQGRFVTAGVPHLVAEVDDAHGMPRGEFLGLASALRSHPELGMEGANVDFVTLRDRHTLDIRCYERGVEGETLSSGSGCIAASLAVVLSGRADSPVCCRSRAGFQSTVAIEPAGDEAGSVQAELSGDARIVFEAELGPEALTGFEP